MLKTPVADSGGRAYVTPTLRSRTLVEKWRDPNLGTHPCAGLWDARVEGTRVSSDYMHQVTEMQVTFGPGCPQEIVVKITTVGEVSRSLI